ncbi:ABC transporter substrate-binding protein [Haloarchaeobius amylolyticus]|uniref:ABC transporter substrate-binding protein n=1 Tax=Haloarchaeobius amylolyticus TaxID=1198296 RepID=A0ABD6BDG4_9EURY
MLKGVGGAAAGVATMSLAGCLGSGDGSGDVSVPGIYDMSGATSDVGKPSGIGSRDAIKWINENDELDTEIDHPWQDYAYDVPTAKSAYDEYTSGTKPPIIIGWGTADTEALSPSVARDRIVYISASYSAKLVKEETPFNFFGNLDYTSQARAHLKWIEQNDPGAKVAFIFSNTAFGKSPVEGGRQYAESLDLDLGENINLSLTANSAKTQLRKARNRNVDYLIHQNTAAPMQVLLADRQEVYPEVNVMGLTYTVDELRAQESPELFEGVRYASGFKVFNEIMDSDVPGKTIIEESFEREGRSMDDPSVANLNYVRGVIHALLALKGLKNAQEIGDMSSGADVREGLFQVSDWNARGLAEPFTYAEDDRRPTMNGRIYEVSDGSFEYDSTIELPRKDEWVGL